MIDYFALALIHLLLVIALFRLVNREALDTEEPSTPRAGRLSGGRAVNPEPSEPPEPADTAA